MSTRGRVSRSAKRRRPRPAARALRAGVPSFDAALQALLSDEHQAALARFAARTLADPSDWPSRGNYAIALYQAGRLAEAAPLFEKLLAEEGPDSLGAVALNFSLGYCRLELGDLRGSLEATTEFLDRSNEWHPFYWHGVHNTACAWDELGAEFEARQLFREVAEMERMDERMRQAGLAGSRFPYAGPWRRRRIIERSFRVLGVDRKARRARRCKWPVD